MIAGAWYWSISRSTAARAPAGVVAEMTWSRTGRPPNAPWRCATWRAVCTPASSSRPPWAWGPVSGYTAPRTRVSAAGPDPAPHPATTRTGMAAARASQRASCVFIRTVSIDRDRRRALGGAGAAGGGEGGRICGLPPPGRVSLLLDRHPDRAAPLGPRPVVVPHLRVAQQLAQHEPGVRRALSDPAVGDHLAIAGDPPAPVDLAQGVRVLERAVLLDRGGPGHVDCRRDVAAALGPLLGQVLRCQQLAGVLGRRADVDQPRPADRRLHLVAVRAQVLAGLPAESIGRGLDLGEVGRVGPALDLPPDPAAVDQLDPV